MPRDRSLFRRIGLVSYLNVSRRLVRCMKQMHLPRKQGAYTGSRACKKHTCTHAPTNFAKCSVPVVVYTVKDAEKTKSVKRNRT